MIVLAATLGPFSAQAVMAFVSGSDQNGVENQSSKFANGTLIQFGIEHQGVSGPVHTG